MLYFRQGSIGIGVSAWNKKFGNYKLKRKVLDTSGEIRSLKVALALVGFLSLLCLLGRSLAITILIILYVAIIVIILTMCAVDIIIDVV